MTICVAVKVSEGLVLASDSTATIGGVFQTENGPSSGILKTYDHVRKLSHIKDYPIGTLSWGTALVGARSVESLIKEFEYALPSLDEENEKIKEQRMHNSEGNGKIKPYNYTVKRIADGLRKHVAKFYESTFTDLSKVPPPLGILVSGYSSGKFFPEQWLIDIPTSKELIQIRPDDTNGKPEFGANWYGLADAINRLHHGRDDSIFDILSKDYNLDNEKVRRSLEQLQYPVLFDGMPLQDAIDYAVYLVNIVIGRFRFVVGAPLCGGEIDVAVITPNAFTWVNRKTWRVNYKG